MENFEKICKEIPIIKADNIDISDKIYFALFEHLILSLEMATSLNYNFIQRNRTKFEIIANENFVHTYIKYGGNWEFDIHEINNYISIFAHSNLIRYQFLRKPILGFLDAVKYKGFSYDKSYDELIKEKTKINLFSLVFSPRNIKLYEIITWKFYEKLFSGKIRDNKGIYEENNFLDDSLRCYFLSNNKINYNNISDYSNINKKEIDNIIDKKYYEDLKEKIYNENSTFISKINILEIHIYSNKKNKIKVGIANIKIEENEIEENIKSGISKHSSYDKVVEILKSAHEQHCDTILFPESCLSLDHIYDVARNSAINEIMIIIGSEHIKVNDTIYNILICFIPIKINGRKDILPIFRIKNHYSPSEKKMISGYHFTIPDEKNYLYHLINWHNIYFSIYYCFELADIVHRSIFKSKIDLVFASEWNKDTSYYSNIVEATSRDLHCYFLQSNTSQFGDSRITKPFKTEGKNILQIKGGSNNVLLVEEIDISELRDYQLKTQDYQLEDKTGFKPTPPDFNQDDVKKRINNEKLMAKK